MTRLRVAICDDDPIDLERAIRQIYEYDKNSILEIQSYTKAGPSENFV